MASPQAGFQVSSPVFRDWRTKGGAELTYSEVAWTGASVALIMHATLHFFSVAITGLERFLVVFAPVERFAVGVTEKADPIATWLLLLVGVGIWGALIGVALLATIRIVIDAIKR